MCNYTYVCIRSTNKFVKDSSRVDIEGVFEGAIDNGPTTRWLRVVPYDEILHHRPLKSRERSPCKNKRSRDKEEVKSTQ